jgi:hypothetical protein
LRRFRNAEIRPRREVEVTDRADGVAAHDSELGDVPVREVTLVQYCHLLKNYPIFMFFCNQIMVFYLRCINTLWAMAMVQRKWVLYRIKQNRTLSTEKLKIRKYSVALKGFTVNEFMKKLKDLLGN